MRRQFHLQLEKVHPDLRKPKPPANETRQAVRQLMFANLRRRVMIDCEKPFDDAHPLVTHPDLNRDFRNGWLNDCVMGSAHEVKATIMDECPCDTCERTPQNDSDVDPLQSYHFHWLHDGHWTSVGLLLHFHSKPGAPPTVERTWDCAEELHSSSDYVHAITMAMDDALHHAAMNGLSDTQLKADIISRVEDMLVAHMTDAALADIRPKIEKRGAESYVVSCEVDLDEVEGEPCDTITASRFIQPGYVTQQGRGSYQASGTMQVVGGQSAVRDFFDHLAADEHD